MLSVQELKELRTRLSKVFAVDLFILFGRDILKLFRQRNTILLECQA